MKNQILPKNKYVNLIRKKRKIFKKDKKRKIFKHKKLTTIFFLFFLLIVLMKKKNFPKYKYKSRTKIDEKIYITETLYEAVTRAKDFYHYADSGILTTDAKEKVDFPKLSVVIPMNSAEKTIKRAVLSAQNQNFYDIEIIIIDDFSLDNSLKIVEEMSKEDPRIKIIKNHKNLGTLYSRCIGALMSKGLYILPLDSDDMFLNNDTFSALNLEIDKLNVDIIKYRGIESLNANNPLYSGIKIIPNEINDNKILNQPDIGIFGEKRCVLWQNCINAKFYKKGINLYGKERMSRYRKLYILLN